MSEKVLNALLQIFAIIARPDREIGKNVYIVEKFLRQQLNQEFTDQYLTIYKFYFEQYQQRQIQSDKLLKKYSASSVRLLKISTHLNEELNVKQKTVVLILLLEFINADPPCTEQSLDFLTLLAEMFHFPKEQYQLLQEFEFKPNTNLSEIPGLMQISPQKLSNSRGHKSIHAPGLEGLIWIMYLPHSNIYLMRYEGTGELMLNNQLTQNRKINILNPGASIKSSKIIPLYFSDIVSTFKTERTKSNVVLEAIGIGYTFKNGKIGIHSTNMLEKSGKLVGIMGSSGTGKTTLLNLLNGNITPTTGEVLINGINIHKEPHKVEGVIGYVSQDDLLIDELTVFENLYFNAKLCLENHSEFIILRKVCRTLQSLGLYNIKDMKVGSMLQKKISGGQRKRLNIALELIREPAILFLDEPTSGLSSRDSENILDILKELTSKGKLIFVVIHQPSSDIFKLFDKLVLLDTGGHMIYYGDPVESIIYFKSNINQADWNESECPKCGNVNPEQIFNIVESQVIDEFGNTTFARKISPKEWNDKYIKHTEKEPKKSVLVRELPEFIFKVPGKLLQTSVFIKRDVLSKLYNLQYLIINLIETPLLAFLLSYIIKYYDVDAGNLTYFYSDNSNIAVYIFMAVIVSLFVGLSVSAQEIIKDRNILKREQFLNLSRGSYLASKIMILFTISALQSLMFVALGNSILEINGMFFYYWLMLFSVWCFGNLMGLNISDGFKTSVNIYIIIPFLIIPQIVLSGVLVKFDKLNPKIADPGKIPWYGEILTARWAFEGLVVKQYKDNEYEKMLYGYDQKMSNAVFKNNYWLRPLENKVNDCMRNQQKPDKKQQIKRDLTLIYNEITIENIINPKTTFPYLDSLKVEFLTKTMAEKLFVYFKTIHNYYNNIFHKANKSRDSIIQFYEKTKVGKIEFQNLKRQYFNENLEDLLTNSSETRKVVEYESRIYQKYDQIFTIPQSGFLFSHFYAPKKRIFGQLFDTYWVNLIVIWFFNFLLYVGLHLKLLQKLFEISLNFKFKKNNIDKNLNL